MIFLIPLTVLLAVVCVLFAVLYIRERTRRDFLLKSNRKDIEQLALVIRDLNMAGGGYLELRRVDPDSVFLKSPM